MQASPARTDTVPMTGRRQSEPVKARVRVILGVSDPVGVPPVPEPPEPEPPVPPVPSVPEPPVPSVPVPPVPTGAAVVVGVVVAGTAVVVVVGLPAIVAQPVLVIVLLMRVTASVLASSRPSTTAVEPSEIDSCAMTVPTKFERWAMIVVPIDRTGDRVSEPSTSPPSCGSFEEFEANLAAVRGRITAAAERAGRDVAEIRLLPVTKTLDDQRIEWAARAGVRLVGENKAQEARSKDELFTRLDLQWAMIGHLQTNKIRHVVGAAVELHSLDRIELAEKLDRRLQTEGTSLDVFIQVNSSGEQSKFGLEPDAVVDFARAILGMDTLRVRGLMTLAVNSPDRALVGRCFDTMCTLRDRLQQELPEPEHYAELSMGMSGDYELAIEHGATTVRVGQALFGARATPDAHYWPPAT